MTQQNAQTGGSGSAVGTLNGDSVIYQGEVPYPGPGAPPSPGLLSNQYGPSNYSAYPGEIPGSSDSLTWNGPTSMSGQSFTGYVPGTITCTGSSGCIYDSGGNCTNCTTVNAGTYVANPSISAPPTSANSVPIVGGDPNDDEFIYFATPVTDPLIAIWSLGSPSTPAVFIFDETIELEAGGPDAQYGGSSLEVCTDDNYPTDCSTAPGATGTIAYGEEGSGIVMVLGTFGDEGFGTGINSGTASDPGPITFQTPNSENFYSMTVGEEGPIPEPETLSLLGLGLLALPLLRASLARRRRA